MNLVEKNIYSNKFNQLRVEITEIRAAQGMLSYKFIELSGPAGIHDISMGEFERCYAEIPVTHVAPPGVVANKCYEYKQKNKLCDKMHLTSKTCSVLGIGRCMFPNAGDTPLNLPIQPGPVVDECDKCGEPIDPNEPGTHHVGTKMSHARCGPLDAGVVVDNRPVCNLCEKPINHKEEELLLGKNYHPACIPKLLRPGKIKLAEPFEGKEHKNPHNRDAVMSHNVGDSNYATKRIQPWDIWEEYKLNPWDADILKRLLRDKSTQSRRMDYEKIIHLCQKRISQIDNEIKMYGED